jgi:3-deoxy-D-manno-octulosonic-acid transferase
MWHLLYNVLLLAASPVILAILLAKRRCRRGFPQRFGFSPPPVLADTRPLVWIHAVSLGEVTAVAPLVKELQRRHPGLRFVVSTVTETGREAVEQRLAGVAEHLYAPLDFPWVVAGTVARLRPVLYAFVETELWPNLLRHLSRQGVPTVMVNGRLSTRSYNRQRRQPLRAFYGAMVRSLSLCLMQSDRDVERIVGLGAAPTRVRRTGNIKFDQPVPVAEPAGVMRKRLGLPADALLIVAGSTHAGEEEMVVDAFRQVAECHAAAHLLMAPRHVERAEAVEAMVRSKGLSVSRRSKTESTAGAGAHVTILDTRGELAAVYQEAHVAFVGGTLIPVGGHNLLEPAVWGKPILFGPYTDHCLEIAQLLLQSGGGRQVTTTGELSGEILRLFGDARERERMGQEAGLVVAKNRGALHESADAISAVLAMKYSSSTSPISKDRIPLMAGR